MHIWCKSIQALKVHSEDEGKPESISRAPPAHGARKLPLPQPDDFLRAGEGEDTGYTPGGSTGTREGEDTGYTPGGLAGNLKVAGSTPGSS